MTALYTDTLPSDTELPPIDRIRAGVSHPAWTEINHDEHILAYHHHGGQIPTDKPLTAYAGSLGSSFSIDYWNSTDTLKLHGTSIANQSNKALPDTLSDIVAAINNELAAIHTHYESFRFNGYLRKQSTDLSEDTITVLQNNYNTIYDFLNTPQRDLFRTVDFPETQYEHMINDPPLQQAHTKSWCVYACCPSCNADWYSIMDERLQATQHTLDSVLYCPFCTRTTIPPEYHLDPEPFLSQTIKTTNSKQIHA